MILKNKYYEHEKLLLVFTLLWIGSLSLSAQVLVSVNRAINPLGVASTLRGSARNSDYAQSPNAQIVFFCITIIITFVPSIFFINYLKILKL